MAELRGRLLLAVGGILALSSASARLDSRYKHVLPVETRTTFDDPDQDVIEKVSSLIYTAV